MFQAHSQSAASLIVLTPWIPFIDGLFQPMHLMVIGIIFILLFGKRLPEFARFLGKKLVEFRFRGLLRSLRKIAGEFGSGRRGRDDDERGASPARLDPPDKPRPPAQVALPPPKSENDLAGRNDIFSFPNLKAIGNFVNLCEGPPSI